LKNFSLLCLAARSREELAGAVRSVRVGVRPFAAAGGDVRLAIVYSSISDLKDKLDQVTKSLADRTRTAERPSSADIDLRCGSENPVSVAFLYPGQGAQAAGMLSSLRSALPGFDDQLTRLDGVWASMSGRSLLPDIYPSAESGVDVLRETRHAQAALGLVSTALRLSIEAMGVHASFHAGHSYGELPALCGAGFVDEVMLFKLTAERGRVLEAAGKQTPGGMLAILASETEAVDLCRRADPELEIVNINAPRQVVAAGCLDAIDRLERLAVESGVTVRRLYTACAFHSALMASAEEPWHQFLQRHLEFPSNGTSRKRRQVWSNVSARPYPDALLDAIDLLSRQIVQPVRWSCICEGLQESGANVFIEIGPGRTLSDLINRNLKAGNDALILACDPGETDAGKHVAQLAGRLFTRGLDVDWQRFSDPSVFQTEIQSSQAPAGRDTAWKTFLSSNQSVVEKYLAQQQALIELASRDCGEAERASLIRTALDTNRTVMEGFLAANESGFRALLSDGGVVQADVEPATAAKPNRALPAAPVPQPSPKDSAPSEIEAALRAEISRVTGYPPDAISAEATFVDLGLDSLSVAGIWSGVLERIPELEEYADRVLEVRSIADIARLMPHRESVKLSDPLPPVDDGAPVQRRLIEAIAVSKNLDPENIRTTTDFERDLDLDVFSREKLFQQHLSSHPGFHLAGRELLNANNMAELEGLLARFSQGAAKTGD
jgi:acyl transferase domain-containing protein